MAKPAARSLTPLLLLLGLLIVVCATTGAEAKKKPKTLDFFMFIAVQNNSFLDNPKGQFTAVLTGKAPTAQPFVFANLHTFDNPLSKTMSLANPADRVGRVQGWYGNCGQSALTLCLMQTFAYNDGVYNGTFSLLGSGIAMDPVKFAPIVGGTGDFAFCRGVAQQSRVYNAFVNFEENSWFQYSVTFKF